MSSARSRSHVLGSEASRVLQKVIPCYEHVMDSQVEPAGRVQKEVMDVLLNMPFSIKTEQSCPAHHEEDRLEIGSRQTV